MSSNAICLEHNPDHSVVTCWRAEFAARAEVVTTPKQPVEHCASQAWEACIAELERHCGQLSLETNGLTLDWSNRQREGQVNRLKLNKRQTYGRAKFGLLGTRVLPLVQVA